MSMNDKYKHTLRDTPLLKDVHVSLKYEKWQNCIFISTPTEESWKTCKAIGEMEESQVVSKENKDEANGLRRKPETTTEKRAERSRHREFTKPEAKGQCEDQGPQHPTDLCDLTSGED